MIWLYRFLFVPVLVFLAPFYLRRMWRRGGYWADFRQRLGAQPRLPPKRGERPRVWLQAVSVGEILAVGPILERLGQSGAEVYLTTTTSTGYALAKEKYGGGTLGVGYFPIDWWPIMAWAWRRVEPDLVILMEGERWPEHLRQAGKRGVPVICMNARLSDRSFARMFAWRGASGLMLGGIKRILAVSPADAERFGQLGVAAERIVVTGNMKLDVNIPRMSESDREDLRRALGLPAGLVLLGASTWDGEEAALLAAWSQARSAGIGCSLVLVPRHAERRGALERMLANGRYRVHFRSRGAATGEMDVVVVDTTGELRQIMQLADLVFVGKSLPPHTEGQTPVEAAMLERAIVLGAGMGNFRAIADDLVARGAARRVATAPELAAAALELLGDRVARARLAATAVQWRSENAGALERTWAVIREEVFRS
jgi:3-deoxy-D-manno-octulosonic-acid transferase